MISAETKARMIMASEFCPPLSYQWLLKHNFTGYTHRYLYSTANFSNLTSTAKLDVVLKLAECDLLGIETFKKYF